MNRREAEELLPWFVAGTLGDEETRAVQAFIDSGDIPQSALDELNLFADTVTQRSESEPDYNPDILTSVMAQLDDVPQVAATPPVVVGEAAAKRPRVGIVERLSELLQWRTTPLFAKLAIGAQFAVVLGLVVAVSNLSEQNVDSEFAVVAGTASSTADFTVLFKADTDVQSLSDWLRTQDLQLLGGPNSLGMYEIGAPQDANLPQLQQQLDRDPMIEFVQPVKP